MNDTMNFLNTLVALRLLLSQKEQAEGVKKGTYTIGLGGDSLWIISENVWLDIPFKNEQELLTWLTNPKQQ